jgi:hypothetical protein
MSTASTPSSAPDPQRLGRSLHLRILVVNANTVRHLSEGPNGKPTSWTGPNGERCEARFQYEEPEREPGVLNGERVEWINPTNQPCTIIFDKDEVPEPPFEGGERRFMVPAHASVFSGIIRGKTGSRYRYLVNFPPDADDGGRGNPVIIIRG